MAEDTSPAGHPASSLYVVEIERDGQKTYLVCEEILSIAGGADVMGISATHIHDYMVRHQVLAAPVPGGSGEKTAKAGHRSGTGSGISIGVSGGNTTINVNPAPAAPPPPPGH